MATYIRAEQPGAQLLEASRRQTLANRQGLRDQQAAPEAAEAPAPRPVGRSRAAVIRADELAAFRRTGVQVARGFLSFSLGGATIYSGDKSDAAGIGFPAAPMPVPDPLYDPPLPILGPYTWYDAGMPEDWRTVTSYYYDIQGAIYLALPLSADTFVLYTGFWDYKARHYLYVFISRFDSTSGPIIGIVPKVTDQDQETVQRQSIVNACFLVSRSTVRQITAPTALINAVSSIYQPVVDLGQITTNGGSETLYFTTIYDNPIGTTTPPPGFSYSWSIPSRSGFESYRATLFTAVQPQLAFAYGVGDLRYTPQNINYSFSPVIYSALQKGSTIRAATDQSLYESYSYVNSTFVQGTPFPGRFIDTTIDDDQPRRRYRQTLQRPVDLQTPVADGSLRASGARPVIEDPGFTVPILHAWNWGQEAYCRQQLLALGFTAADLTP